MPVGNLTVPWFLAERKSNKWSAANTEVNVQSCKTGFNLFSKIYHILGHKVSVKNLRRSE